MLPLSVAPRFGAGLFYASPGGNADDPLRRQSEDAAASSVFFRSGGQATLSPPPLFAFPPKIRRVIDPISLRASASDCHPAPPGLRRYRRNAR